MTPAQLIPIFLGLLSATNLAEAWLEVIVIKLKDPDLADYTSLNDQEHRRSFIYSCVVASPYFLLVLWTGLYWLLVPVALNRRLVFDPALKILRRRPLKAYEGRGPVDRVLRKVFGHQGGIKEIVFLGSLSAGAVLLQFLHL